MAEAPGKTYNPLFIYGATGLGKTHLMQAIAHTVLERHPDTRVLYLSAEQFINEVIESMRERTMPEFRRRYTAELESNPEPVALLRERAKKGKVTLLFAARDEEHNSAVVLKEFLEKRRT